MKNLLCLILSLILTLPPLPAMAWSECGHHIISVMAYELLSPEQQQIVIRVLKAHPRFQQDFSVPEGTVDMNHYLIGRAGYWPDVARRLEPWNRPNWHYELGATSVIGRVANVPNFPGPLPPDATLETKELHVAQAIELCRRITTDSSRSDSDKALAICWLCHLVADSHQPCHAGSLYVEKVFPEGDRGANSIPVRQGSNMHALWDGLLGQSYDAGDIRRRIVEIKKEAVVLAVTGFDAGFNVLEPEKWLEESRQAARVYVYAPEVLEPINVAMRSDGEVQLTPVNLSEDYLETAGWVAQLRAMQSSARLAALLSNVR